MLIFILLFLIQRKLLKTIKILQKIFKQAFGGILYLFFFSEKNFTLKVN